MPTYSPSLPLPIIPLLVGSLDQMDSPFNDSRRMIFLSKDLSKWNDPWNNSVLTILWLANASLSLADSVACWLQLISWSLIANDRIGSWLLLISPLHVTLPSKELLRVTHRQYWEAMITNKDLKGRGYARSIIICLLHVFAPRVCWASCVWCVRHLIGQPIRLLYTWLR